tara:strand:+ start:1249 stop:3258 length:2010 start_codon:yes stop_codon:yes gene_type:complete
MAVDIGQIVSSALGGAESSFGRKEQRMNLASARRRNTRKELNNRAINSGLYTLDDTGNFHVDIKKAYESPESRALLLDIINTSGSAAANYKDLNNQIKNGKFADLPKVVDAGDGTANFVGEIEKEDGSIEPLTENRSSSPNDNPALIDAASLELLAEGAMLNSMGEFGIDGTAVAVLQNLNFDTPTIRAQEATVNALRDEKDPAALTQLIAQLGPTIKQTDPNRGNVTVDQLETKVVDRSKSLFGSPFSTVTGNKEDDSKEIPVNVVNREEAQPSTRAEGEKTPPGKLNAQELAEKYKMSPELVSKLLAERATSDVNTSAARLASPAADLISRKEAGAAGYTGKNVFSRTAAKSRLIKDFYADASPTETQQPADDFDLDFDVSEIPTDIEGATAWFSNKSNTDAIEQLDPDKVAKVREFLEDKNINSKKELVDSVKQGIVTANQARSIARITAWSVVDKNGQKDAQLSANVYSGFINEMQTGNPDIDPVQMANAETSRGSLALAQKKYLDGLQGNVYEGLTEAYKIAGDPEKGVESPEFVQKMKTSLLDFLEGKEIDQLSVKDKEAMDGLISQYLLKKAENFGPENFADRLGDFFLRGEADVTLGNLMDNVRLDRDERTGRPTRIVFTRRRGANQVDADQSISWNNLSEVLGEGRILNYFESRVLERSN